MVVGAGVVGFALVGRTGLLRVVPGLLVGIGWGGFCLAAPIMLVERTAEIERERWFMRFGSFQMAGVGGGPAVAALAIRNWHWTTGAVFFTVGGLCVTAAVMLECFGHLSPASLPLRGRCAIAGYARWARSPVRIDLSDRDHRAWLERLLGVDDVPDVDGARPRRDGRNVFGLYSATVVVIRWLLGAVVIHIRVGATTQILLGFMILSVAVTFAVPHCALLHSASAVLLGTGYGLVYPIVQAQAVNSADARHRHAVLTWFVASYFVGVFGFPRSAAWCWSAWARRCC